MARILFHTEAIGQPLTGIGRYARDLGSALTRPAPGEDEVICRPTAPDAALPASGALAAGLRRALRHVPGAYAAHHARSRRRFTAIAASSQPDLYHEPNFVLRPFDGPAVVTCHDLAHLRFPAQQPRRRRAFLDAHLPASLARAERIVVPTAFVRDEVCASFGTDPAKIRVVPEGVAPRFHPRAAAEIAPVLERFGLEPGAYLLSVATLEPRKNLPTLLAAFAELPRDVRRAHPLAVAGSPGWHSRRTRRRLARLAREGTAHVLGHVADDALPALYAGAAGFAYMSVYEGFGLPVLEAMASGVPVLASDAPALVEVTGGAALHVPARDAGAVRDGLDRLLTDASQRAHLADAGRHRAAMLTWASAAAATRAIYRDVLAGSAVRPTGCAA